MIKTTADIERAKEPAGTSTAFVVSAILGLLTIAGMVVTALLT